MRSRQCLSSNSYEWATPQKLFDLLNYEFGPFTLDPCASIENAKCYSFYTKEQDGLQQNWSGRVFCNPPYGHQIGCWVKKAYEASRKGVFVVMLIPSRTDTRWWHEYCMKGEIRFLKGRVHFVDNNGKNGPSTFPSAIVIFRP